MPEPIEPDTALRNAVNLVLNQLDHGNSMPLVLVDGRSASGKTTFATRLQAALFKEGESLPRLVHMDDLYEGWNGLEAGHDLLLRQILAPLQAGKTASWQEYDWELGSRNRWREFSGGTPLIVEGCGSLSRLTAPMANLRLWFEADTDVRRERWISRVGHEHDAWWPIWAAQELEFYAREKSAELADCVVSN